MTAAASPKPRISVVTISFNQVKFLAMALDSLHRGRSPGIEHVVVDPGSTDGSREFARSYQPPVICVFESDKGPADGLNKGFERTSADILYFLNADDEVEPGALAFAARFFEKNPDVDVLYGGGYLIDENNRRTRFIRASWFTCDTYLRDATNLQQQSFFFRRRAFERAGGFNPDNRVSWDGELFFRMRMAGCRFHAVSASLGCFRVYTGTVTTSEGHAKRRAAVRERLAQEYLGRKLPAQTAFSRLFWMGVKQVSTLLIHLRTLLMHRRDLKECGVALISIQKLWRVGSSATD